MTPQEIFEAAELAATKAAQEANAKLPSENLRGFDCGFAWVKVRPATGPFVNWCKKQSHQASGAELYRYGGHYNGGWEIWCTRFADTQSVSVHRAAAYAFAKVLTDNGINALVGSRLDW